MIARLGEEKDKVASQLPAVSLFLFFVAFWSFSLALCSPARTRQRAHAHTRRSGPLHTWSGAWGGFDLVSCWSLLCGAQETANPVKSSAVREPLLTVLTAGVSAARGKKIDVETRIQLFEII